MAQAPVREDLPRTTLEYLHKHWIESDEDVLIVDNFEKHSIKIGCLDKREEDSSFKVDAKRINKELEGCTTPEMFKSKLESIFDNRENPLLFRSAQNLIFAMRWLSYSSTEKEQVRMWVRNNADAKYKSPPPLNMSVQAMCNYIGYVDTPRFKCNCIYIYKLVSFIAGSKLHLKLMKKYEEAESKNPTSLIHINE